MILNCYNQTCIFSRSHQSQLSSQVFLFNFESFVGSISNNRHGLHNSNYFNWIYLLHYHECTYNFNIKIHLKKNFLWNLLIICVLLLFLFNIIFLVFVRSRSGGPFTMMNVVCPTRKLPDCLIIFVCHMKYCRSAKCVRCN